MATSGSIDFTRTRNELVSDALKLIGAIEAGETASGDDLLDGAIALNKMVKAWQADGLQLWKTEQGVLFLEKSQAEYNIGGTGDHVTLLSDMVKTEVATAIAASATALSVDSITGIAASDNIGVVQDDDTTHWTTVNGAPTGTTVTLTTGMTSAAAVDQHVYTYTSKILRPLRITGCRRRDGSENDIPIIVFSRQEYWDTPNKTNETRPVKIYYDPQVTLGIMRVWPTPANSDERLIFTAQLPLEDFDASGDTPDYPQEWLEALTYNLAVRLAPAFGTPMAERQWLKIEATEMKALVMGWDTEPEGVFFQPDLTAGGWN